MILILAAILLPTALGLAVLALLFRDVTDAGLLERLGLSYPLGMGLLTFQMLLLALMRVPLSLASIAPLLAVEAAALAIWAQRTGCVVLPKPSLGLVGELRSAGTPVWRRIAIALLAAWIAAKCGSVLLEASLRPIYAWDAWANWSASAKAFFHARGLLLDAPGDEFFGGGVVSRIRSYPLHNHFLHIWLALWAGGFDEVLVKFWSPFYLLSAAAVLYTVAFRETGRLAALGLVVVFLGSPLLSYHAVEAYSDLMLGTHLALALAAFLRAMRGSRGSWGLVGFFSAAALFTKNEAPGFLFPLFLSAGVFLWTRRKETRFAPDLVRLVAPLAFVAPWFLFKLGHSLSLTQDAHTLQPVWHPGVLSFVVGQLLRFENFGILIPALVVLLVLNGRPSRELLHLLAPVAFHAGFLIILYYLIEYYHSTLLMGTIFFRNTMTYYPAAALVLALVLKELLAKTAPAAVTAGAAVMTQTRKRKRK